MPNIALQLANHIDLDDDHQKKIYDLNLEALPNSNHPNLIGKKLIKVFNSVPDNRILNKKVANLSNLKLNDINLKVASASGLYLAIIQNLTEQLTNSGLSFSYVKIENFEEQIKALLITRKVNKIQLKIIPLNFLTFNNALVNVTNDLTNVDVLDDENFNDLKTISNNENSENDQESFFNKKENLYWFIPLMVISIIGLVALGL